jgi:hypothetical protein
MFFQRPFPSTLIAVSVAITAVQSAPAPSLDNVIAVRAGAPMRFPITPMNETRKCIDLLGGKFANGTEVDMYVSLILLRSFILHPPSFYSSYIRSKRSIYVYDC